MAEISREEAIHNLEEKGCYECTCASDKGVKGCTYKFDCPFRDSINKAISDMEKLEKIEQIVEEMWDENSYYNNSVRFAEKIEQIVKE